MTSIKYVGPFVDGVVVPSGFSEELACGHGESIEVDDDLANSLLDQPTNWQLASSPAPTPQAPESPPAPTPAPDPVPATDMTPPTTPATDAPADTQNGG